MKILADDILQHYIEHDYAGANISDAPDDNSNAAPLPGQKAKQAWKPLFAPLGPIGLILLQSFEKGAAINQNYDVITHKWPSINILKCPLQKLKPASTTIATHARTRSCKAQRKINQRLDCIDTRATNASKNKLQRDEQGMLMMVQQGAGWDRNLTNKLRHKTGCRCEHWRRGRRRETYHLEVSMFTGSA